MHSLAKPNEKKLKGPFTPQSVAALRKRPAAKESQQRPMPVVRVNVDAGHVLEGLLKIAAYFQGRKAQHKREIDEAILNLARHYRGFLGLPDVLAHQVCREAEGLESLQRLERQGHCQRLCQYQDEDVYVFPEFLVREWECPHCQAVAPFAAHHHHRSLCPCEGCGAKMEIVIR